MICDDDINDYLFECAMNRYFEDRAEQQNRDSNVSPMCRIGEQYCHAFQIDGVVACEGCFYNKNDDMDDEDEDDGYVDFKDHKIILKTLSRREIQDLKIADCLNGIVEKVR